MKKIVVLLLGVTLLVGCGTNPQSQAENGVKAFLKKNVQVYEPISFGALDTLDLSQEPAYKAAKDSLSFYMSELKETADQFKLAASQANAKRLKVVVSEMESFYEGKKFRINHKYKANTSEGKKEEVDKDFYLNSMFNVVE